MFFSSRSTYNLRIHRSMYNNALQYNDPNYLSSVVPITGEYIIVMLFSSCDQYTPTMRIKGCLP